MSEREGPITPERRREDSLAKEVAALKRKLNPWWFGLLFTVAGALGGYLPRAFDWLGGQQTSPGTRIEVMETRIGNAELRMTGLEDQVEEVSDSVKAIKKDLGGFITSSCLDPRQVDRLRQAQVACAALLRERGIIP